MKVSVLLGVIGLPLSVGAQTLDSSFFTLQTIKPGIIAAIATPSHRENANATIIVLDSVLMVVDAQQRPSAAAALIRQIRSISPLPVKYLINTHFHDDHVQGNNQYRAAWPSVQIISSDATRESLRDRGDPQLRNLLNSLPLEIDSLRRQVTTASPERRLALEASLHRQEAYLRELRATKLLLPMMTFDQTLVFHVAGRTVELRSVGRAHTDGDVLVYLPDDRVLVTGDVVDALSPWMGDSHPYAWIKVLGQISSYDIDYMIGGHGGIMRGTSRSREWHDYLQDLMAQTASAFAAGASLETLRREVGARLIAKYANIFPASFRDEVIGHIERAYRVISGNTN